MNTLRPGYVTLLSVLLVGALGLAITVSLLWLGIATSQTTFSYQQSKQANELAHGCAEEGLEKIRESSSFIGTNTVTLSTGTCTYTVTNTGGNTRTIDGLATVGDATRKVRVTISAINPQITVSSWQEVSA